ncbi:MAG: hypothetical protein QXE81_05525 [Desulfurococcaceae archaeon]
MRIDDEKWRSRKEYSWKRIWEDLEIGYLDRDLLPLLVLINKDIDFYTTSSCSGRIVILDADYPWERDEARIVFKSHTPINRNEMRSINNLKVHKKIWIIVNGPIIHIYSKNLRKAALILRTAREVGFKHSGIIHASRDKGVFIELVTGVYTSHLLKTRNEEITQANQMFKLVEIFNDALIEGKKRLDKLYIALKEFIPEKIDEQVTMDLNIRGISLEKTPMEIFKELVSYYQR